MDDVVIAGYPLGNKVSTGIKTTKGSVTSLSGMGNNFSEFQTDAAPIIPPPTITTSSI